MKSHTSEQKPGKRDHPDALSTDFEAGESSTSVQHLNRVTVIIPALNEQESLPSVLNDLPKGPSVVVVDNGSTDDTATIANNGGARVVYEPRRGYGSACLKGMSEIRDSISLGAEPPMIVVFVDADYSDHVDLLPELVAPIFEKRYEFVLGSRMLGKQEPGAMPPQSRFGNRLACFLMRLFFRASYTDLGPFRAIEYQKLLDLNMVDTNFGWTVEMQIKAARLKLRTVEIAVPYRKRIGASKISGTIAGSLKAGYKILYLIFKYGFFRGK